jgi:hypothetical protein
MAEKFEAYYLFIHAHAGDANQDLEDAHALQSYWYEGENAN